MNYYDRLNDYFPEQEMKDRDQLSDLIKEKDFYFKDETEDYVLMYAEFSSFLFVDYILVDERARGKGVGSKVIEKLKNKGKTILLEVEPIDKQDEDTKKRIQFYERNGFVKADRIKYQREDDDGNQFDMIIYYWTPVELTQEEVMDKMAKACEEIHNFRTKKYYGRVLADPDEVLELKEPAVQS
ncbi:N-acetyltransferase [Mechercharimyces sp. CAU 1602]|uniref:GNAT family N-acetyltransferase n=1 Tax=Mechercharimyces sp. CAU 1602 TaxID=2973933 RepID=UPI002161AE64|nr:GNAT family N-acetyltransferase [Mechercharimyces sp. CAU 1602]MCS1351762.1 GNAT family N-acetyltransferase [Mechercharimyces sp. CAU 1602]